VGGLLAIRDQSTINNQPSTHFVSHDGNGNVAVLVTAVDGTMSAKYEYGPFGELLRATGLMAKANSIRFSAKYDDDESDLLYYGYRYYNPSTGTWPNRDPIGERGGNNLYAFVNNNGIGKIDPKGRSIWTGFKAVFCSGSCRKMISDRMHAASDWANDNYGTPKHMHSDAGSAADMLSHCVGACEVAKGESVCLSVGIDARGFLQWREFNGIIFIDGSSRPKNPDSEIDMYNNIEGFAIADSGQDCKSGCVKALNEGRLWTVDKYRQVLHNEPSPPSPPVPPRF
jgi:RHS repeat-associated protein